MNMILFRRLFLVSVMMPLWVLPAKGNPLDSVPNITYRVVVDTISTRHPDIRMPFACAEARLIDMKRFNDTLFLFIIPANQDTLSLYTLYFEDEFILKKKRPIQISTHPLSFVKPSWTSLTAIHYDTIAMIGQHEACFYDMKNHDLFYTLQLEEHQMFTSYDSPLQHIPGTTLVVTEHLDFARYHEFGRYHSENIAAIDYHRQVVHPLPLYMPDHERNNSITSTWHYHVAGEKVVGKYSFVNHFNVVDPVTLHVDTAFVTPHGLPSILYIPKEEDLINSTNMARARFLSHEQVGMTYNRDNETLWMLYMMPADEKDIQGLLIPPRDVLCLAYDNNFATKGKVVLPYPYVFLPSIFFTFDDKMFLFSLGRDFMVHIVQLED